MPRTSGRKPRVRSTYSDDAVALTRLINAVMRDEARPLAWRQKVSTALNEAVGLMMRDSLGVKPVSGRENRKTA